MSLILLGYMGSGKSTLSKRLGNRLKLTRYDLDEEIVKFAKASINEIFEQSGENVFRDIERYTLEKFFDGRDKVLSVGGGAPCFKDNMELMKGKAFTVYLKMKPKVAFSRLKSSRIGRPLIEGKSEEELLKFIKKQLKEREKYYSQADLVMDADKISAASLDEIKLHYLKWYADRIHSK